MRIIISAVIMASGLSRRFNSGYDTSVNKLLLLLGRKTVVEWVFCALPNSIPVCVVTRSAEIEALARAHGLSAIFHTLPTQADTIRLGANWAKGADGCLFLVADQPLLSRDSVERILSEALLYPDCIIRLKHKSIVGNPVYFPKDLFGELSSLAPNETGRAVISRNAHRLRFVEARFAEEMRDLDTASDYEEILNIINSPTTQKTEDRL